MRWRKMINEKCKDCIYDPSNGGNWRQQVTECTVTTCPLYPIRPVTKPRKRKENNENRDE